MEKKTPGTSTFVEQICATPGGESIRLCIQCGTCTASCPNANRMDYAPREIIALARAGMQEEVLASNSMWYCASCYLCTVRCPRDIKPTELMHALECLAVRHGLATRRTDTPIMYKAFVDSIKSNGRIHELGFMIRFYLRNFISRLRTNPLSALKMVSLVRMMPVAMGLFSHGRLALRGTKIKGNEELKAIIKKSEELGGAL